jgi:hypothetical protein
MFTFKVTPDSGEPYDLTVKSRDIVFWEKIDRNHTVTRLENDPRITDIYSVTHVAAKRQGKFSGTLAEWEISVDLDSVEEAPSDPIQPGLSPG